jgi:hypothetical protein
VQCSRSQAIESRYRRHRPSCQVFPADYWQVHGKEEAHRIQLGNLESVQSTDLNRCIPDCTYYWDIPHPRQKDCFALYGDIIGVLDLHENSHGHFDMLVKTRAPVPELQSFLFFIFGFVVCACRVLVVPYQWSSMGFEVIQVK